MNTDYTNAAGFLVRSDEPFSPIRAYLKARNGADKQAAAAYLAAEPENLPEAAGFVIPTR